MPAPRFYYPGPLQVHAVVELPAPAAHHALRTLRLKDEDAVILFNGSGGQYAATLQIAGNRVLARVDGHDAIERELAGRIGLIQGYAASDKMDWIIEKAVELGVREFYPIAADRSVLKLTGERLEKRLARWRTIARAASEQCGRNQLLHIHEPTTLDRCLAQLSGTTLVCHPEGTLTLASALASVRDTLNLAVGPEGGWSPDELAGADRRRPLEGVRFGTRVLRTETAGMALVAAATALLGW